MQKKTIITLAVLVVIAAGLAAVGTMLWNDMDFRTKIKDEINQRYPDKCRYTYYYVNNILQYQLEPHDLEQNDVKEIQVGNGKKYMVNHSRGFAMEFPRDTTFDLTSGNEFIKARTEKYDITVSKEFSPYR